MVHKCTGLLAGVGVAALLSQPSTAWAQPVGPDLTITMSHRGNFTVGQTGIITIVVSNIGGTVSSGQTVVIGGLGTVLFPFTFVSATGAGWSCVHRVFSGEAAYCTNSSPIAAGGAALPPITLTVIPTVSGTVTNTATVDNVSDTVFTNNLASDVTIVVAAVPTLPEWAMIVLTGLLALAGVAAMRRRTTGPPTSR